MNNVSLELLTYIKQYLRIEQDWTEDDSVLSSLIIAAKNYIKNATGIDIVETNELHKLALSLLVIHWYENREIVGKVDKLAFSLDSILKQITYSGEEL